MEPGLIGLIFNSTRRQDTTGIYCKRALEQFTQVELIEPSQLDSVPSGRHSLYINIDEGTRYRLPPQLRPCVWWAIDTHVDYPWYREKGGDFDVVFTAQLDGANRLRGEGITDAVWLPLACDPQIHGKAEVPKQLDLAFVGNNCPGERERLLEEIQKRYPNSFIGRRTHLEMAQIYSASRLVFNRSVKNDVNMRVFEAVCSGSLLITNDLSDNGLSQLFQDGVHLATYSCDEELFDKIAYYLKHDEVRERIADQGRRQALAMHTYRHRMELLVKTALERLRTAPKTLHIPNERAEASRQAGSYFDHARPELLEMVPAESRSILDIGCGAGRLGEAIKSRQPATVAGIELNAAAAGHAAARLDEVLCGDIETLEPPFEAEQFDCIICGDVLEHLQNPKLLLQRIRRWLAPHGRLVASIPNVRNHAVVRSLLAGNWTYEPAGLLDATHIQFFTRRSLETLFDQAGYSIEAVRAVLDPEADNWKIHGGNTVHLGPLVLQGMPAAEAEEFFVYQYLVMARPKGIPATVSIAKSLQQQLSSAITTTAPIQESLGCVIAVQNRPSQCLERTFQTYRTQSLVPFDQLLLDYGSDASCASAYRQLCQEYGWRYHQITPADPKWRLSNAYNLAISQLKQGVSVVFKNDADVLLGPDVLAQALRWGQKRLCIFALRGAAAQSQYPDSFATPQSVKEWFNKQAVPEQIESEGILAFPLNWFKSIGGFDCQYDGWGYEDSDLRLRAQWSIGLVRLAEPLLVHQWHPRSVDLKRLQQNRHRYERMKLEHSLVRNECRLVADASAS